VFDMPLVGAFKTLHVMLFFLGLVFGSSLRTLQIIKNAHETNVAMATTPNYEINYLSKRWRAERNMWLSAFAFTAWAVLAAFYRELGRRLRLESRLVEFEMSAYTATVDDTTREASVSKEVTSRQKFDALSPRSEVASPSKSERGGQRAAKDGVGAAQEGVQLTPVNRVQKKEQ
jgi:hypothetical protein